MAWFRVSKQRLFFIHLRHREMWSELLSKAHVRVKTLRAWRWLCSYKEKADSFSQRRNFRSSPSSQKRLSSPGFLFDWVLYIHFWHLCWSDINPATRPKFGMLLFWYRLSWLTHSTRKWKQPTKAQTTSLNNALPRRFFLSFNILILLPAETNLVHGVDRLVSANACVCHKFWQYFASNESWKRLLFFLAYSFAQSAIYLMSFS
jgi:hypothetical protein